MEAPWMDIKELRKSVAALPKPRANNHKFTQEELDLIMEYWPIKQHGEMARAFGVCPNTLRDAYRKEKEKRGV